MKSRNIVDSFNAAIKGLLYSFKTERNIKIHFTIALFTLVAALLANVTKYEAIFLFITITVVTATELINTSIERVVDILHSEYHPLAEVAKNVAAAAVLVTAVNAVMVGYIIFYNKISWFSLSLVQQIRSTPVHITLISLIVVVIIVIIMKSLNYKGNFLRGGMPSGHSALAFSLFTSITMLSGNALISSLSLLMALMVLHSRYEAGIHTLTEIIMGAFLGILSTIIIFELLRF